MAKRWKGLIIVGAFLGALLIVLLSSAGSLMATGKVLTVDDDEGGGEFSSIQDAINEAVDGDTIRVYNGTYRGRLTVNSSVSIIGNGTENTTLDVLHWGSRRVKIESDNVSISELTFTGGRGATGAVWVGSNDTYIHNTTFYNNSVDLYIQSGQRTTIKWNTFQRVGSNGIMILNGNHTVIDNNSFTGNHEDTLIRVQDSSNVLIHDNVCKVDDLGMLIENCTNITMSMNLIRPVGSYFIWSYRGIVMERSSGCNVTGNIVHDFDDTSSTGISLIDVHDTLMTDNYFIRNSRGLRIVNSTRLTLRGNYFHEDGIYIDAGGVEHWNSHSIDSSNTVNERPICYLSDQNGGSVPEGAGQIILANCSNMTINGHSVDNTTVGILLGYSHSLTISMSSFSDCALSGIVCYESSFIEMKRCKFLSSRNGINLVNVTDVIIRDNDLDHTIWGIYISNSYQNISIIGNRFSFCNGDGISLQSSRIEVCEYNDISFCSTGIFVDHDSHGNTLRRNTLSDCREGIHIMSENNAILRNTIIRNTIGIRLYDKVFYKNNSAHENHFVGNEIGIWAIEDGSRYIPGISFDARYNYWEDDSGPYHPGKNPNGNGNNVTDRVDFSPWYDSKGNLVHPEDDDEGWHESFWILIGVAMVLFAILAVAVNRPDLMFGRFSRNGSDGKIYSTDGKDTMGKEEKKEKSKKKEGEREEK